MLKKAGLERASQGKGIPEYAGKDLQEVNQLLWSSTLKICLQQFNKSSKDIKYDIKSAKWKVCIACAMKQKTSATNVWIADKLNMGVPHGASRYVSEFRSEGHHKKKDYKQLIANMMD